MRKYEYETGRFTSIDPLWNKYYGWTPYQYSMNSPVALVDFDGKIVRDENGEIIFDEQKIEYPEHYWDNDPFGNKMMLGYIYADDGSEIEAYKNLSDDERYNTNCHGCTFADGEYWIDDIQVEKILNGDNYTLQLGKVEKSDVAVFYNEGTNTGYDVIHSETVESNENNEIILYGLGGLDVSPTIKSLYSMPPSGTDKTLPYSLQLFYTKNE